MEKLNFACAWGYWGYQAELVGDELWAVFASAEILRGGECEYRNISPRLADVPLACGEETAPRVLR